MQRILNYFTNRRLKKEEHESFLRHAIESYKKTMEDEDRRTRLRDDRMNSDIPWCKLIGEPYSIQFPPIDPISERYEWNNAFIKKLRMDNYKGETDAELISQWEVDVEHSKISASVEIARNTKRNSKEPWVEIVSENYDDSTQQVEMKLDWNQAFINMLKSNGYTGRDEQEIIDKWFKSLVGSIAEDLNKRGFDV